MFPNRVPTDRDTPSPQPLAKQGDSIYSFIHVCLPQSPKRSSPTYIQEKHKVTIHEAPSRRKAYIQWGVAWFPKGIINDNAICTPVPCSLWHTFHLGLGRPEPRQPMRDVATPNRVYSPQPLLPPPWPRAGKGTNLQYPKVQTRGWFYGRLRGSSRDYKIHVDMEIVTTVHTSNKNICLRSQKMKSV